MLIPFCLTIKQQNFYKIISILSLQLFRRVPFSSLKFLESINHPLYFLYFHFNPLQSKILKQLCSIVHFCCFLSLFLLSLYHYQYVALQHWVGLRWLQLISKLIDFPRICNQMKCSFFEIWLDVFSPLYTDMPKWHSSVLTSFHTSSTSLTSWRLCTCPIYLKGFIFLNNIVMRAIFIQYVFLFYTDL
jgi:hypothetical protein